MVQRYWEGQIVSGFASSVKVTSPLQGHMALWFACGMVESLSINAAIIESDN